MWVDIIDFSLKMFTIYGLFKTKIVTLSYGDYNIYSCNNMAAITQRKVRSDKWTYGIARFVHFYDKC